MTISGTQGTGFIPGPGAGAQVTGQGTRGSTGARTAGVGSGLQGVGVGPAHGHSPGRDTGHSEEQQADVVLQEVTSGRRRPKWLQDTEGGPRC